MNPTTRRLLTAAALIACPALQGQTVMAPGHQPPGAPLPRYIYNVVAADFAASDGHPLVKSKFNVYDPTGVTLAQLEQSMPKMGELKVDTYRIELAWGRPRQGLGTNTMIGGAPGHLTYDFTSLDRIVKGLHAQGVQLLGAYSYTPEPLQDRNLEPRYGENRQKLRESTPTKDLAGWKEAITAVARHYREIGIPFGIHETWNEPDGTYQFFSGTEAEYQQLYKATVEAARSVDADAVVAGPAADHHLLWNETFPEFVAKNRLPLDVYSFHEYGSGELATRTIDKVNRSLNRFAEFRTTAMNLDEWHDADCCNWCNDDVRNRYEGAAELLHDFTLLLSRPELTSVSWAWWLDPGGPNRAAGCMGLLTRDGRAKAVYNAWKLYASMPVDRRKVIIEGPLEAIASSDRHKAAMLIWNRGSYERRMDVHLKNLPFTKGTVRIYRIDAAHGSVADSGDDKLVALETYPIETANWSWLDGRIPKYATVYFEADDGTGESELAPAATGRVIRINRYYPARGATKSYADFDRRTWIARLGMMDDAAADQEIGVLADGLPDTLDVTVNVDGKLQKIDRDSMLTIRLDYRVDGAYSRSVVFHGPYQGADLFDKRGKAALPWGLKPQASEVVAVPDFARFQIPLKKYAPSGWAGTAHISFVMQKAGQGTRVKMMLRPR